MRVAILGAGGVGSCAALELAKAGCTVDLFERQAEPLRGATYVNEGKIHQGFIYANDDPARTARTMAVGALTFRRLLARWIDVERAFVLSTPFVYAVLDDSMLGLDRIRAHFGACLGIFGDLQQATGFDYLGSDEPPGYRELDCAELADIAAADRVVAAFETTERGVDPRPLADALVAALARADGITLVANAEVQRVERRGDGRFMVTYADPEPRVAGPYDQVINALWESRLAVDRTMGLEPPARWSHRHKFGTRVLVPLEPADVPSLTCMLGPYGDIVNYGPGGLFLSWYPAGMVSMTSDLMPPRGWDAMPRSERLGVFRRSLEAWLALCPRLGGLVYDDSAIDPVSGMIVARGDTDIDDFGSRLHRRDEAGVRSVAGYHSVDTGKYTLVPLVALEAANRVLGRDASPEQSLFTECAWNRLPPSRC
jgi:hypothetical protein